MVFKNQTYEEERALYGVKHAEIIGCTFDGPADGESALKECSDIRVQDCEFRLRYPFWHMMTGEIVNSVMTEGCRAALWYDRGIKLTDCRMDGIKALRECDDIVFRNCIIHSPEFGWKCRNLEMLNCELTSEYPFFECQNMKLEQLKMTGKYSFQYVENVTIRNSHLQTKDAFWHSKNVTVEDSVVQGEYLGWYSDNLRLVRCRIMGTQPLCYAKGLVLEDCEMEDTDLAFENSEVQATVRGSILSVKNPAGGFIQADSIGEIIKDEYCRDKEGCKIICK